MGLFKDDPPDPPDYTPIANASADAARYQYQISQQQLEWAKQQYGLDRELADQLVSGMKSRADMQDQWAQEDRQRYQDVFAPLENQIVDEAKNYDTPERRALEAQRDMASVGTQFDAQREAAQRNLESYGIDPSSTRYAALDVGTRTAQAAAQAGAGNEAMRRVEATGQALKQNAVNLGRGFAINPLAASQAAQGSAQGAINSNLGTTASGASTMGTGTQWAGAGNQSLGTWANALNMGYNNSLAGFNAQQSSGLGALIGGALGAYFEDGGDVDATTGGPVPAEVSPSRGLETDDVPAQLNVGEFVVPKDVKEWKGEEFFHKLIKQAREAKAAPKEAQAEYKPMPQRPPRMVSQAIAV